MLRGCYDDAQARLGVQIWLGQTAREDEYVQLISHRLGLAYAKLQSHPCCVLCKRLLWHEYELCQLVLVAGLRFDNTLAKRSSRELVAIRKIGSGSRSDEGTTIRLGLASLFETATMHAEPLR